MGKNSCGAGRRALTCFRKPAENENQDMMFHQVLGRFSRSLPVAYFLPHESLYYSTNLYFDCTPRDRNGIRNDSRKADNRAGQAMDSVLSGSAARAMSGGTARSGARIAGALAAGLRRHWRLGAEALGMGVMLAAVLAAHRPPCSPSPAAAAAAFTAS